MVADTHDSILAAIGKAISPIFAPLGFEDWRAATALITGLSAKEAVVSTFSVLTGSGSAAALSAMLSEIFTPLSAIAFMAFCLLYMPCIATLATVKREMGGWRFAIRQVCIQTATAWCVAFLIFNIGSLIIG